MAQSLLPPGIQWQCSYGGDTSWGGGKGSDNCRVLKQTSDGGYIIGGESTSDATGNKTSVNYGGSDYWVVKVDANGNKQWDKSFGGTNYEYLYSLQQTTDGGYILGGYSSSGVSGNKTSIRWGGEDYWIVKLDSDGNKQWEKSFGGTRIDSDYDDLRVVQQTSDGGFILGGVATSGTSVCKTDAGYGGSDYWIVKTDASGNKQWDKCYGGDGYDDLTSLQQTSDGGFILAGMSYSGVSGNKTSTNFGGLGDYWIVKTDTNGNIQWQQDYGGSSDDQWPNVLQTSDGGYIIGGHSSSGVSGNKTSLSFGGNDYWVLKLDSSGKKVWEQSYGGTSDDYLNSIQQTSDGGYILGGTSSSGISGNKTSTNYGGTGDYWVVKIDVNGIKQWEESFGGASGDYLSSLQQANDGGFILGGTSYSSPSGNKTTVYYGNGDYWIIKLAPPLKIQSYLFDSTHIFQAHLTGISGTNYVFQASSDLINWTSIATNNALNGLLDFSDTNAANFSTRYYRVRQW